MPDNLPTRVIHNLPNISAEHYQHVGRYAGAVVLSVFEQLGGVQNMVNWASENETDFYTKIFNKLPAKATQVDHSGTVTIDDAINRIQEADYTEVLDL